jgi:predicted DNA-binding transcriptional regulator YafY
MGQPPEIRLSVSKHQAQYLITQPLHESQFIESEDDENVIFQFKLHPTYEFKSLILSMGSDARVLSPDKLKKDILRLLNDAILEYGKDDY